MNIRHTAALTSLFAAGLALTLMAPTARVFGAEAAPLTPEAVNAASLADVPEVLAPPQAADANKGWAALLPPPRQLPVAAIVKLQVLLDRAGASPGVIDGLDGDNVRKAVAAYEMMQGRTPDGLASPGLLAMLGQASDIIGSYTVSPDDVAAIVPPIPSDYGEMARLTFLGYASVPEELAERFHMDEAFLKAINPGATFAAGDRIFAAITGPNRAGEVAHIVADKAARQVRAYDAAGALLAAYPATIGSADNPSPSGIHTVEAVVHNPTYTYNPKLNFKQGDNDKVLTIPPGPNGPVGSVWIDLSEPTFGIHGTPEPSKIDKTGSHGCVRLTNWDAEELAGMVKKGVTVEFTS